MIVINVYLHMTGWPISYWIAIAKCCHVWYLTPVDLLLLTPTCSYALRSSLLSVCPSVCHFWPKVTRKKNHILEMIWLPVSKFNTVMISRSNVKVKVQGHHVKKAYFSWIIHNVFDGWHEGQRCSKSKVTWVKIKWGLKAGRLTTTPSCFIDN